MLHNRQFQGSGLCRLIACFLLVFLTLSTIKGHSIAHLERNAAKLKTLRAFSKHDYYHLEEGAIKIVFACLVPHLTLPPSPASEMEHPPCRGNTLNEKFQAYVKDNIEETILPSENIQAELIRKISGMDDPSSIMNYLILQMKRQRVSHPNEKITAALLLAQRLLSESGNVSDKLFKLPEKNRQRAELALRSTLQPFRQALCQTAEGTPSNPTAPFIETLTDEYLLNTIKPRKVCQDLMLSGVNWIESTNPCYTEYFRSTYVQLTKEQIKKGKDTRRAVPRPFYKAVNRLDTENPPFLYHHLHNLENPVGVPEAIDLFNEKIARDDTLAIANFGSNQPTMAVSSKEAENFRQRLDNYIREERLCLYKDSITTLKRHGEDSGSDACRKYLGAIAREWEQLDININCLADALANQRLLTSSEKQTIEAMTVKEEKMRYILHHTIRKKFPKHYPDFIYALLSSASLKPADGVMSPFFKKVSKALASGDTCRSGNTQ